MENGKGKKLKKKKHRLLKLIVVLLLLGALAGIVWYEVVGVLYTKVNYEPIRELREETVSEDKVTNILLIGNDSRSGGTDGRSDAMILVSISDAQKKIHMTSLLRDMYVEIPGHDNNRLNAAYSYGGPQLLMETIELNFGIEVNRYVSVNFQAFANLINAVGGVELEVTSEEIELINAYLVEYNILENRPEGTDYMDTSASGKILLNGPQALAFSRNRYIGNDFGRTERQRKILEAAIQKLPSAMVNNTKELINGILPNLTTNLSQKEMFVLSFDAPKILTYELVQGSIPIEGSYKNASIRGMSVLEVDFEANKEYIQTNIY